MATIAVALIVPAAGGIVEVVLTIGAVTGCSIYGPPIWALFSKYHNGSSIWACTVISLLVNLAFKFLTPHIGFALDRPEEMLVGALLPFALLAGYEIYAQRAKGISAGYHNYLRMRQNQGLDETSTDTSAAQNHYGMKVLAITLAIIGLMVIILGLMADSSTLFVTLVGACILGVGIWFQLISRRTKNMRATPINQQNK